MIRSLLLFWDSQISCRVIHGRSALRRPTTQRFGLRDDQWERIKDLLPGREGHVGGNAADNRLFVDAVLYRYRTGVPWRDLPARFGDWNIVYQRFNRWAKSGVFDRIFKLLASAVDNEYMMIDASVVRAHQRGITPVIPPKANRNIKRECDFALYCERNLVERFFNLLKHFRAIATRYDKLARNVLAGVQLAALTILLN